MTVDEVYQYIEVNTDRGRPTCFWGTKITPEHIIDDIEKGMTLDQILTEHPALTEKHLEAAVVYAREFPSDSQRLFSIAAQLFLAELSNSGSDL